MVSKSKRQQPHQDEISQFKAIHGSLMNNKDILTPLGRLQLAQTTTLYTGTAKY